MAIHVMWFRKDLRLEDNTALTEALLSLQANDQLLCMFHLNEKQFLPDAPSHDYFFSAVAHFIEAAKKQNLTIHLLTGTLTEAFDQLFAHYPEWSQLYFNFDNRGYGRKRDLYIKELVEKKGVTVHSFEEHHLHQPTEVTKEDGTYYKKFTPYYKKWIQLPKPVYQKQALDFEKAAHFNDARHFKAGTALLAELLKNRKTDFSTIVGEDYAHKQLQAFVQKRLAAYEKDRDLPSIKGTSRLSPFLSFGQLSIRKVWAACQGMPPSTGKATFLKELAWRDFYHMIYFTHPEQKNYELIEKYRNMDWQKDEEALNKWQAGQTGYPIIDAAMRQLNQTGWMHNRLRMIVASFLTKDLLIDWRQGEAYFARQLIDYDAASNIGGWQWAASTGTDAVPYFRIFNPITQGKKFDKDGTFIKQFVPELAQLPLKFIHEPYLMTDEEQADLKVVLGTDYPLPIVDHNEARKRALDLYSKIEP